MANIFLKKMQLSQCPYEKNMSQNIIRSQNYKRYVIKTQICQIDYFLILYVHEPCLPILKFYNSNQKVRKHYDVMISYYRKKQLKENKCHTKYPKMYALLSYING